MPKTEDLQFTCKSVTTETQTASMLSVLVREPNLTDILDSICYDDYKAWTRNHISPSDLFDEQELERWAKDNGYVKEAK